MMNKVVIGMLAFLVILSSGLGGYSFVLNQQIKDLSEQLGVIQREQAAQMGDISDELTTFRGEALARISTLKDDIGNLGDVMGNVRDEMSDIGDKVGTIEDEIGTLGDEIKGVATEVSQSVINANRVYQKVRQATVSISDGESMVGTGFMLDNTGHVVTAHHVVDELSPIFVVLSDGRSSKATVAGTCEYSDVAVLTLDDEQLFIEPLILADSSRVQIGEPVAIIGNPLGLTETLTSGIVSQKNRFAEIKSDLITRWVANLIQFDGAVNYGNSGSPLVNSHGEVIGMVIARVDPETGDGIYYAVSSDKVRIVAASLIDQGSFDYPWFGIEITGLTPEITQDKGLETTHGVLVRNVLPDSPAETSGIEADDIIIAVDAVAIRDISDLTSYLGEYTRPDQVVSVTIIRESEKVEISLKIGKRSS